MSVDSLGQVSVGAGDRSAIQHVVGEWRPGVVVKQVEPLGGMTNRNFKVVTSVATVAVRLPGPGTNAFIDRAAEAHNGQLAAELGIGAKILHVVGGAMVTAFIEGQDLTPVIVRTDGAVLEQVGRLLGRLHGSTPPFASRFDPTVVIAAHRAALGAQRDAVPDGIDAIIARLPALTRPDRLVPCHIDPWPANFIATPDGLRLLDWEYSAMGDPAWDLADVAVEAALDDEGVDHLLSAYAVGLVDRELRQRVVQMGPVTDVVWALWAFVQEVNGNRDDDFATYGRRRLDRAARCLC